jgi:hypothetical protein
MSKYTVYGNDAFDRKIDSLLEIIAGRVVDAVGRKNLAALALGGGYGRGEGGVLLNSNGEMSLYNDLDFFVITSDISRLRQRRINRALRNLSPELSMTAGIDVDFSPAKNISDLNSSEFTLMWQELKYGHVVIYGQENILGRLPAFDLNNMPHEELAKLMLNRGTGLLLARQRMEKSQLKDNDVDFIARNIWKAVMACGDSYLAMRHAYSYSYKRRSELFDAYKDDQEISGFYPWYKAAVEFKLKPVMPDKGELPAMWNKAREFFAGFYLHVFNVCLGAQGMNFAQIQKAFYQSPPFAKNETFRKMLKNFIINMLEVGPAKFNLNLFFKYPRTRLFIVLPAILFDNEAVRDYILLLPGISTSGPGDEILKSYLKLWDRFN